MLPFDAAPEVFEVAGIALPRYGCSTVAEAIAFDSLIAEQAELLDTAGDQALLVAALHLNPIIAALILISRNKPGWSLETVRNFFSVEQVGALAEFALGERRRWKVASEAAEPATNASKPTDWAEVFWSLQLHYPGDPRFSAERFGGCPIAVIEQALAAATRLELERANRAAQPIALLGFYLLTAQGIKTLEPAHFNPFERALNQQAAAEEIDPAIARTLVGLIDSGRVPSWAIPLIPLGRVRLAARA